MGWKLPGLREFGDGLGWRPGILLFRRFGILGFSFCSLSLRRDPPLSSYASFCFAVDTSRSGGGEVCGHVSGLFFWGGVGWKKGEGGREFFDAGDVQSNVDPEPEPGPPNEGLIWMPE